MPVPAPATLLCLATLSLGMASARVAETQGAVARPTVSSAAQPPIPSHGPSRATTPVGVSALNRDMNALLNAATRSGRWGVIVVSLTRGDTLFAHEADELLLPASTMKLYTAALAFERFGPAYQFRTEVLRNGDLLPDGTVDGDLYLKGAGDPSLGPRYAQWNEAGVPPMDAIADLVWQSGIRRISGDVVGDASAFDGRRVPDGWRSRSLQSGYAARVSALSVNENVAHVVVRSTGRGATVQFAEHLYDIPIHSTVTVREGSRAAWIRMWQDTTAGHFRVQGWIGALSPERVYRVVVEHPEQFAAASFRAALERRGIVVDGGVRPDITPRTARRVTAWASAPLAQLVVTMNGESNNHFAELILRNAARSVNGIGSADSANEAMRTFIADRVGGSREAVFAADGSGLSTLDRVTARSMVQLLGYTQAAPWGQVFRATLPVAGRTETLRTRMRRTPADNNLRGKTGTTNEVSSLGGYVTTRDGELLSFAFLYNGRDLWRARDAIDAMGVTIAGFSR